MLNIKSKTLKRASYDFSSTQIDLPPSAAGNVQKWSRDNLSDNDIYHEKGDRPYGREENTHCTVKFGLHTNDAEVVRQKIKDFGAFEIELGEVSRFVPKDKPYNVVKIEVESDRLHDLNKLISELPNSDEHPQYKPHITVAYIKDGTNTEVSGKRPFAGIMIPVTEIVFSPKNGDKVILPIN